MIPTDRIRNVVLVGHDGNGKTSLAEVLLYRAGALQRPGQVERGDTVMDFDPEERSRGQSLSLSVASFAWGDHHINLIDTPGYADFRGDTLMGMAVAELAVFVIDGVAGVQANDIALWRHADAIGLPRMIFINKLDRERSSFDRVLGEVRDAFGSHTDPVELPIGEESSFHGIADVLTDHAFVYDTGQREEVEMPAEVAEAEHAEHEHLIEEVIELDDELLEHYLEGEEPTREQLERLLHEAVDQATVFPVLCGSATTPIGADALADFICRVGPAPGDRGPAMAQSGDDLVELPPDPDGPAVAVVFKTSVDDFVGQLSFFKVISGTIRTDDVLVSSGSRNKERLHQLMRLHGAQHTAIGSISAGDIGAVAKLSDTRTGDTLSTADAPIAVPVPELPTPVFGVAIHATAQSDEDRLATLLRRLTTEDPTLRVHHDDATSQTVLSGGGETHLRVALARVDRAGIGLDTDDVAVAYRETLAGRCEVEGRHKKQSGGHGQFGVASVRFEPLDHGGGFEFESEVTGGAIPRNLIPAVGAGIEESMKRGGRYGFPMVDVRAVCTDGKHHSVDSSEMSFKMAGAVALREAIAAVGVRVLEPVSELSVRVPSRHQGDVLGDLNSRRGQVLGTDTDGDDLTTVHAIVPTSEVMRYAIDLRSMTGGSGTFEISHHGYQELPEHLVDRVVKQHQD